MSLLLLPCLYVCPPVLCPRLPYVWMVVCFSVSVRLLALLSFEERVSLWFEYCECYMVSSAAQSEPRQLDTKEFTSVTAVVE
eukprot:m.174508 g.174508  ORF g.174508 m.174508 type:complete len:82 (-) comp16539_c4_seq1:154-399(-)